MPYQFESATLKEVHGPADYPDGRVFVIQFWAERTIHHEADQRSKDAPGHGYPESWEDVTTVRTFVTCSYDEWETVLAGLFQRPGAGKEIAAFVMEKAAIKTEMRVVVGGGRGYPRDELG